jgi:adenine-specific DNA-methyltransferase
MSKYLPSTKEYINNSKVSYRKKLGQYFTPYQIQQKLLDYCPNFSGKIKILDPSCGTGEFLCSALERYPEAEVYGWEIDKKLVQISKRNCPEAKIINKNSLETAFKEEFDLIIGNPPYFQMKLNEELRSKYSEIVYGRFNIFAGFIYLGLRLLKDGGILAYVLPPSMNNGAYFNKLRQYVSSVSEIRVIDILDKSDYFDSAQQLTMLLVLKKKKNPSDDYIFKFDGVEIFTPHYKKLNKIFKDAVNLKELGYIIKTGSIVWNQNKELLSDNDEDTLLIWSHNITEEGLVLNNKEGKKQYIKSQKANYGPAIVVNRITGAAHNVAIRVALIPEGIKFLAENHVNVIFPPANKRIEGKYLPISEVYNKLTEDSVSELFSLITGNTQVSKTELELLFPITL